jgi:hypothetical protein
MMVAHEISNYTTFTNRFAATRPKYRFFRIQLQRQEAERAFAEMGAVGLCE